jgi:hypothetical protein
MAELVAIVLILIALAFIIVIVAIVGWFVLILCRLLSEAVKVRREMKGK